MVNNKLYLLFTSDYITAVTETVTDKVNKTEYFIILCYSMQQMKIHFKFSVFQI